jgi:hypothetical protein
MLSKDKVESLAQAFRYGANIAEASRSVGCCRETVVRYFAWFGAQGVARGYRSRFGVQVRGHRALPLPRPYGWPVRYVGPVVIGKATTPATTPQGPEWIGKTITDSAGRRVLVHHDPRFRT